MYFQTKTTLPATYLPPDLRGQVTSYHYRLTRGEKKRLKKLRPIPPSKWAERHRVVTKSAIPGRWRNRTTPYLAGVMDASYHRSVEEIVLVATPQVGKSEGVNNCVGYAIDRDPADVLYVYPDELTSKENSKDRVQPMITSSRRLLEYTTGYDDDMSVNRINLTHMAIYFAWANSAARLANKPIGKVVLDEVDKYPATTGKKETGPIELARKRMTTYKGRRKMWLVSTPTIEEGPIWQAYQEAQVRFVYWVQCPACGGWQVMELTRIRVPDGRRDPKQIKAEHLAWYDCAKCPARWDDAQRDAAVRAGQWRESEKGIVMAAWLAAFNPASIAFQIPSWLSPFVSLSEVMAAWFAANPPGGRPDKTKLKDFQNGYAAEPWVAYQVERLESTIMALCEDRPMGRVPGGGQVSCLTFGADTQDDGVWFKIVAHGWGLTRDQWVIRCGFATTLEGLEQVLWSDAYADADGNPYLVRCGLIDAMGHRTAEVYDWCRQHPGKVLPTKGERTMNQPYAYSRIENYPNSKKPIPGGLNLVRVNTKYFKDQLAAAMAVQLGDPGSVRMPSDLPLDYAAHYTSEYVNDKGDWDCRPNAPNHLWDCGVLNNCAAEIMQVRFWKPKEEKDEAPKNRSARPDDKPKLW